MSETRQNNLHHAIWATIAIAGAAGPSSGQPVLQMLPWSFTPMGVRADGGMLAGSHFDLNSGSLPATWTTSGGVQVLPVPTGATSGEILGVSDDGSFAVGNSSISGSYATLRSTVWRNGLPVELGHLPGGERSAASGVSGDGRTVVGWSDIGHSQSRAFRWTQEGGLHDLGTLNGLPNSGAVDISHDGAYVAGNASGSGFTTSRAFRWTPSEGMMDLGLLDGGSFAVSAAMSGDGSVITGIADIHRPGTDRAYGIFRWSEVEGMEYIGALGLPFAERTETWATGVSAAGDVIVGHAFDVESGPGGFGRFAAVYWSRETGLVDLNTYLPTLGLNLTGYSLLSASVVSADGSVIAGTASAPDGSLTSYVVSGVPAPGPAALLALTGLRMARRRRVPRQ